VTRTRHITLAVIIILVMAGSLPVFAKDGPEVSDFSFKFSGHFIVVSFSVSGALDRKDMKEAILSTRPVTLTFYAQMVKHRSLWKNKVVAEVIVKHLVRYDTLTKQFHVQTLLNDELTDDRVLATWEEMERYMVSVSNLKLVSVADLEPSEGSYTVRAKVHVLSNLVLWIVPWSVETSWAEKKLVAP